MLPLMKLTPFHWDQKAMDLLGNWLGLHRDLCLVKFIHCVSKWVSETGKIMLVCFTLFPIPSLHLPDSPVFFFSLRKYKIHRFWCCSLKKLQKPLYQQLNWSHENKLGDLYSIPSGKRKFMPTGLLQRSSANSLILQEQIINPFRSKRRGNGIKA